MARFVIVSGLDIKDRYPFYKDPQRLIEGNIEYRYANFLVDHETETVVFTDVCESEDATLDRHYAPLVSLLNQLT